MTCENDLGENIKFWNLLLKRLTQLYRFILAIFI